MTLKQARPSRVSAASVLLCISIALGPASIFLLRGQLPSGSQTFFTELVTLMVLVWLTYKIWVGRNWARIAFTVLFALGFIFYVPILLDFFRFSAVAGTVNLSQALLQLVALYLLFTGPSRRWFEARSPVV